MNTSPESGTGGSTRSFPFPARFPMPTHSGQGRESRLQGGGQAETPWQYGQSMGGKGLLEDLLSMGRSVKEESKCPSAPGQLPEPRDPQPQDYSPRPYPAVSTADSSRSGGQHRGQFPVRRSAPRTAPRSAISTADSSCGCITVAPWRLSPRRPVPLLQRCLLHAPSTSPRPCHQASFPCHTACSSSDIVLPVSPTRTTRCLAVHTSPSSRAAHPHCPTVRTQHPASHLQPPVPTAHVPPDVHHLCVPGTHTSVPHCTFISMPHCMGTPCSMACLSLCTTAGTSLCPIA